MADYRTIADAEVDPDAPLTSSLGYAWRDNPIAIAEGATGAPRITLSSLLRPTAGNYRDITVVSREGSEYTSFMRFSCMIGGVVRIRSDLSIVAGSSFVDISIYRNGNSFSAGSINSVGVTELNVPVNIGDIVSITRGGLQAVTGTISLRTGNDAPGIVILPT